MSKRKTQTILSRLMELHLKTIDLSLDCNDELNKNKEFQEEF